MRAVFQQLAAAMNRSILPWDQPVGLLHCLQDMLSIDLRAASERLRL
jgi:hypothetical protein